MTQLIQKTLFTKRVFTLNTSTLDIMESGYFKQREWAIPLDEISPHLEKRNDKQSFIGFNITIGLFCMILWVANFNAFIFVLIAIAFYAFINRENSVIFIKTKPEMLVINRKRPSKQDVDAFIDALFSQQKTYLKWKFGTVDADLDFDVQIVNFRKLRNMAIISDDEYEQLKTQLKDIIKAEKG